MRSLPALLIAALAASLAPRPSAAHGVVADVDQRSGSVAVRARYAGGRPLAEARYEVLSPRAGAEPFAGGRTDRHGWLVFTPDAPGRWTVRIADATGHGRVVNVDVAADALAAPDRGRTPVAAPGPSGAPAPIASAPRPDDGAPPAPAPDGGGTTPARALAGVAAIAALFGALFAVHRARRARGA